MSFVLPELDSCNVNLARAGVKRMIKDAKNSALERVFMIYGTVGEDKQVLGYFSKIYANEKRGIDFDL